MATVKALAKSLGILAAIYLCCRYVGEFSSKQSSVIMLLAWTGFELYAKIRGVQQPLRTFSPFCVHIYPNWYPLLLDFKLIGNDDEWKRLCELLAKVPEAEYSVFRSGISFTVIAAPSEEGLPPGLIYADNHKRFLSEADFSENVVELERGQRRLGEHPYFKHPYWANLPEVYFKLGPKGYDVGLEVQSDWWKHLCKTGKLGDLANLKVRTDHLCGTTKLVIATLPFTEFHIYYQTYDQIQAQQESADKQLEANGWRRQVEKDSEIQDPWSRVDHKYFAVAHRDI